MSKTKCTVLPSQSKGQKEESFLSCASEMNLMTLRSFTKNMIKFLNPEKLVWAIDFEAQKRPIFNTQKSQKHGDCVTAWLTQKHSIKYFSNLQRDKTLSISLPLSCICSCSSRRYHFRAYCSVVYTLGYLTSDPKIQLKAKPPKLFKTWNVFVILFLYYWKAFLFSLTSWIMH